MLFQNKIETEFFNLVEKKVKNAFSKDTIVEKELKNAVKLVINSLNTYIYEEFPRILENINIIIKKMDKYIQNVPNEKKKEYIREKNKQLLERMKMSNGAKLRSHLQRCELLNLLDSNLPKNQALYTTQSKPHNVNKCEKDINWEENYERVNIKNLKLNFINYQKELKLKVISRGIKRVARVGMVEDERGYYELISWYNLSRFDENKIKKGVSFLLRNPFYKISLSAEPSIRVDSPEKMKFINESEINLEKINEEGRKSFKNEDFVSATQFFKESLEIKHELKIYTNLILSFYRMRNFQRCLKIIKEIISLKTFQKKKMIKVFYYEVLCCVRVCHFEIARTKIEKYSKEVSSFLKIKQKLVNFLEKAILERSGKFDLCKIVENPQLKYDIQEFKSEAFVVKKIRNSRGYFAVRNIKEGELLLVSKSFSSCVDIGKVSGEKIKTIPFVKVKQKIVQLLKVNPEFREIILNLSDGEKPAKFTEKSYDILIDKIISANIFHPSPRLIPSFSNELSEMNSCSFYIDASFFNHRCISNCSRFFIGDLLFIHANRPIQKGEELTVSYVSISKKDRKVTLERYGIKCSCEICAGEYDIILENKNFKKVLSDGDCEIVKVCSKKDNEEKKRVYRDLCTKFKRNPFMLEVYSHYVIVFALLNFSNSVDEDGFGIKEEQSNNFNNSLLFFENAKALLDLMNKFKGLLQLVSIFKSGVGICKLLKEESKKCFVQSFGESSLKFYEKITGDPLYFDEIVFKWREFCKN